MSSPSRTIAICISARKALSVNFSKVAEACFLKVVRSLRIVTAAVFHVSLARLQAIVVTAIECRLRILEDVMAIAAVVIKVWVITELPVVPPWVIERTIDGTISPHNYDSTLLCLSVCARQQRDYTREKQRSQNEATKST